MDLAFALMAFPNMIAVFALSPKVMKEARRFFTMNLRTQVTMRNDE